MERFNYPNLAAVYEEDAAILQLLELESYGDRADQMEEIERKQSEVDDLEIGSDE
jgi:hypothetical protein